jgi:hypothetical protein
MTTDITTNKYKATFEVPALVRIEIELDASNQQDGLITAHDLIHQALPGQATVVSLSLDQATNTAFERIECAPVAPPNPLEVNGRYRVELFDAHESDKPAKEGQRLPYGDAKSLAESVLAELSPYGSARVTDEFGVVVLRTKAPRGGFEVHAYGAGDTADAAPAQNSDRLFTWLATVQDAKRTALELMKRRGVSLVRIVDFTDRQAGPRVLREIR